VLGNLTALSILTGHYVGYGINTQLRQNNY